MVPAKALEAIITEVDQDLVHIKKNMSDHPPRRNTGPENLFAARITADQSSSVRMKKERQQEWERCQSDRKARGLSSSGGLSKSSAGRDLPDLPGSDIHPPSVNIRYSIRLVENWMRKNDSSVATYSRKDLNNKSMVSVVGGGMSLRPAIDVGVWKACGVQNGNDKSSSTGIIDSQPDKLSITQPNNCVYDAPSQDLYLDMRIFDQVAELALRRGTKHQFQRTLSSMLERKKVEKLSRKNISTTEAVRLLHAKQRRRERTDLMSGGRSSGPLTKTLLETVVNSSKRRTSLEHFLTHSVALNTSEVGECIENARTELKMETSSHKPTVPVPIGRPLPSAGTKDTNQLRRDSRQVLAKSGTSAAVSRDSKMSAAQPVKRIVAETEKILKDDLPTKSTYVRYFQSRKYNTSDAAQNAIKRRIERRDSMADNGNSAQDRREHSQPVLAGQLKPRIYAGSFDPEYIRPKERELIQARNTNRTSAERTEPVAIEGTRTGGEGGMERLSPNPFNRAQSQHRRKPKEPEISEVVKSSRRRRAERDFMPFSDRYRNEERKTAWTSTMKESVVRIG
jgi:hypothetical protein